MTGVTIGEQLRAARERRGWSLRDLEQQLGSSIRRGTLSHYERDVRLPNLPALEELAQALKVSIVVGPARTLVVDGDLTKGKVR